MIEIIPNHNKFSFYSSESPEKESQSLGLPVPHIQDVSEYIESQSDSPIYSRDSKNDFRRIINKNILQSDTISTGREDSLFAMSSSITSVSTIMLNKIDQDDSALSSTLQNESEDSSGNLSSKEYDVDEGHLGIMGWHQIQENKSPNIDLNQSSGYLALNQSTFNIHSHFFDNSAVFKQKIADSVEKILDDSEYVGIPSEISVRLKEESRIVSESFVKTLYPAIFDKTPVGCRLYSQAAATALKLNKMREDAKRREEEETAAMFHPKLIAKRRLKIADDKQKVYNRLYEYSKVKNIRRDSHDEISKIDQLREEKCKVITIEKAAALYERAMAQKREKEKKLSQLSQLLTPTFAPILITKRSRVRRNRGESFERLYIPNYFQERDEKLNRKKEKINDENCTFRPMLVKSFSEKSVLSKRLSHSDSIWKRLSSTCQLQDISKNAFRKDSNSKLNLNRSKSQMSLKTSSVKYKKGTIEYERLYNCQRQRKLKYTPDPKFFEFTFQPRLISSRKMNHLKSEEKNNQIRSTNVEHIN